MINYDYLSCTDYNGTTKMLDMFPSELPSVKDTAVALVSTDNSDPTLVHMHKASAASDALVKGDGTGLTIAALFLAIHPVGSIFMTTDSTNPSALYGGTWVAWGAGRVPVGVAANDSDFNTVEQTGGSKNGVGLHMHNMLTITGTTGSAGTHDHTISTCVAASKTSIENSYSPWAGIDNAARPYLVFGHDDNIQNVDIYNNTATLEDNTLELLTTNFDILENGQHTHSISLNGGKTDWTGTENGNLQPYITCYMWKRTA